MSSTPSNIGAPGAKTATKPATTTLGTSAKFKTFVVTFSCVFPVTYLTTVILNLPLFTFHPATYRLAWGHEAARSGEGPNMTWYGWILTSVIVASIIGIAATLLPEGVTKRIPLWLIWLLPILATPIVAYTLMPFWTKG